MVSQTTKYALRVIGVLARHRGTMMRAEELAAQSEVPGNYLSKILNHLRKNEILESQKGWRGGFRLRDDAMQRPISDIVAIIDGPASAKRSDCAFGLAACDPDNPCPLHAHWEKIQETYNRMLSETRVADLASKGPLGKSFCT